jgi:hypothetical protein
MHTRQVDNLKLQRCLLWGLIVEGPYRDIATQRWRCNVRASVSGHVITAVVEIPEEGTHLEVVTVF